MDLNSVSANKVWSADSAPLGRPVSVFSPSLEYFGGTDIHLLGKGRANKSDEFSEKCQRGGVIFNPKIYVADFENFKQGFLIMKLIQKSNFRVQGMFFQQLY